MHHAIETAIDTALGLELYSRNCWYFQDWDRWVFSGVKETRLPDKARDVRANKRKDQAKRREYWSENRDARGTMSTRRQVYEQEQELVELYVPEPLTIQCQHPNEYIPATRRACNCRLTNMYAKQSEVKLIRERRHSKLFGVGLRDNGIHFFHDHPMSEPIPRPKDLKLLAVCTCHRCTTGEV